MISNVEVAKASDGGSIRCQYCQSDQVWQFGINKRIGMTAAPIYGLSGSESWRSNWKNERQLVDEQIEKLHEWMTSVRSYVSIESIVDHLDSDYGDPIDQTIQFLLVMIAEIRLLYESNR